MEKQKLNLQSARELLEKNMQNINLRRHCLAVGKALSAYFDYYQEKKLEAGGLTKEQWEIVGILHDSDWELTSDNPKRHTLVLLEWLEKYETPKEMVDVFRSHNNKVTNLRAPKTLLEWTLECCDELTGFIVAVALVTPSKKLADVTVERILKKFKQKEFARAVHREQITQCEEKVGIKLDEFVLITLKAMQSNSDLLGL